MTDDAPQSSHSAIQDPGQAGAPPCAERFAIVLDSIRDAFFALDGQWRFTYANRRGRTLLAALAPPVSAPIGATCWEALTTLLGDSVRDRLEATRAEGAAADIEVLSASTGAWYEVHASPTGDGMDLYLREVTRQRATEEELRQTNQLLVTLVAASPLPIVALDVDCCVKWWNAAAERVFGWSEAEVLNRPCPLVPPGDRPAFAQMCTTVLAGNAYTDLEARRMTRDGRVIDVSISVAPLRDLDGAISGITLILTDITARKRNEEGLHLLHASMIACSQARSLRAALTTALESICRFTGWLVGEAWLLSDDGASLSREACVAADRPEYQAFCAGSAPARFVSGAGLVGRAAVEQRPMRSAIGGDSADDLFLRRASARAAGLGAAVAIPVLVSGRVVTVLAFFMASARPEDEDLVQLVSVVAAQLATLIERQRAAQQLEEGHQRYRSLFEFNPDAVYSLDLHGRFVQANPACAALCGATTEALLGTSFVSLLDPVDRERGTAHFRAAAQGATQQYDAAIVRSDGSRVEIAVTNLPVVVGGEIVGVYGVAKDVTERHQAQEALRRSEEQLRQSQKMEAIGRLAGGIAHDFNNLLTAIIGHAQLLRRRVPGDDPVGKGIAEIKNAADRASALTQQLLAFSRRQVLTPAVLDLNVAVLDMESLLRRSIGEHIQLETNLAPGLWAVRADRHQLQQVLLNLAVNARDAMPAGGRLVVETHNVPREQLPADDGAPAGGYVALVVRDTGIGMSAEVQARAFEPFYTTKPGARGTGLGLATVYGIVTQSGGLVRIDSREGAGTTMTVLLPRVEGPPERWRDSGRAAEVMASGVERVLLVEDNDLVRRVASSAMTSAGFTVLETASAAEALTVAQRPGISIDALVTDVVMPEMSGWELARRLLSAHPQLRVLFMSGYIDPTMAPDGVLAPGTVFLRKPFEPEELVARVRETLDRR